MGMVRENAPQMGMRERMVEYGSESTIFAFYINMLTTSWMCILSKGDRRSRRVTVKLMQ